MLNQMEVSHFKTFGFVVFRGLLSKSEVAELREEVTTALANAYGSAFADDRADLADSPAFDLPMMSVTTPFAARLIADDPRFWQASHYLMGAATVPSQGEATCFRANTKWHVDITIDRATEISGVKFLAYLDPCSAEEGQLQLIPGSHLAETLPLYWDYIGQDPERQGQAGNFDDWPIPAYGIDTQPGDVIAIHTNLLHSSVGGDRRFLWDVYYFADPAVHGEARCEIARDAILHIGDYGDAPFDRDKWPVWRDWAASADDSGAVLTAVRRLRRLGVLDTPGADLGRPKWEPRLPKPFRTLGSGSPPMRRSAGQ